MDNDIKKRILLLNRSFWPDIEATGQFLTELCEELSARYKVTVVAGRSYHVTQENFGRGKLYTREKLRDVDIIRVRHTKFWKVRVLGRIINWLTYSILSFAASLRIKADIIIVCTDPPFLGIIGLAASRIKSVPFIYNCRDIYPDVPLGLGKIREGALTRLFDYFNRKALCAAALVVPLGESMKTRLLAKGVPEGHIWTIPDWVDVSKVMPVPKGENRLLADLGLKDKFVIMYSGNIGLSQDFSSIVRAAAVAEERDAFVLVFIGEGAYKAALEKEVEALGLTNALFLPYQPADQLSLSFSMADLHLIPLKKGLSGLIVPSKVYGIMAAGRAYLAITDDESEPARFAKEFGCGFWVEPGDVKGIADVFNASLKDPRTLDKMGKVGRHIAETKFDKHIVIREWFAVLEGFDALGGKERRGGSEGQVFK